MTQTGHYLPNFIDWMEREAKRTEPKMKATEREVIGHMKRANRNGIRFALQDTLKGVLPDKHPLVGADLRPPYPITIIEYAYESGPKQNVIIVEDLGTHVKLRAYASYELSGVAICPYELRVEYLDHWAPTEVRCWSTAILDGRLSRQRETAQELHENAVRLLDTDLSIYARLCEVLANNHVETTDVAPDDKANRIRRIKGQAPLYTYKTLVIGAAKARQTVRGGGTHASPRSHLRRGFYRTSPKGVRHWVKATMVMGETLGFVDKDYRIEGRVT